jgi:hypothetical protein
MIARARAASLTLARSRRWSGGSHHRAVDRRHQLLVGYRAAFPRIPTRSNAALLSFSFMKTISPGARSGLFVPRCPKVPDLLEIKDRWFAFSEDCRTLTLLGRQYHRSHHC